MSARTALAGPGPVAVSVAELQAAYRAARRGEFAGAAISGDPAAAGRSPVALPVGAALIVAAHPGGGASTVALAAADAVAAGTDATVRLVELADPARSGLAAASTSELGAGEDGWRHGRREPRVTITRPDGRLAEVATPIPAGAGERVLVDCGWTADGALGRLAAAASGPLLLACRGSVPGLRAAEQALAALPDGAALLVAVLGPARWPGLLTASCGRRLSAARQAGRVVPVPVDRNLELTGLTGDPLPRPVLAAGRILAAALFPDLSTDLTAGRRYPCQRTEGRR